MSNNVAKSFSRPLRLLRPNTGFTTICKNSKSSRSEEVINQAKKEMQRFWEVNVQKKRPWSPHLTIYSPPLVMRFSFLHRFTGIAMAIVWTSVGCGAFYFTGHYNEILNYISSLELGRVLITSIKFVLCYPLIYHYINGIRHLSWDYTLGLSIKTCNKTGFMALGSSLIIALALAMLRI